MFCDVNIFLTFHYNVTKFYFNISLNKFVNEKTILNQFQYYECNYLCIINYQENVKRHRKFLEK